MRHLAVVGAVQYLEAQVLGAGHLVEQRAGRVRVVGVALGGGAVVARVHRQYTVGRSGEAAVQGGQALAVDRQRHGPA